MNEDLIRVLEHSDNDDLRVLCDIITLGKDGSPRLNEDLTNKPVYEHNYPHNMMALVPEMIKELSLFGGNTFVNVLKGQGKPYSTILRKVAKRLKVSFRDSQADVVIEGYMLQKLFDDMSDRLSDEELRTMAKEFGVKPLRYTRQAMVAAMQIAIRRGGAYGLSWSMNVANVVARQMVGRGVAFASSAAMSRGLAVLTGPIGWALTAAWTAYDIAGPAYRVIVPAVIQIAYLRQKQQLLGLPAYNIYDSDDYDGDDYEDDDEENKNED